MEFLEEFEECLSLFADGDIFDAIKTRSDEDLFEFAETCSLITRYYFTPVNTDLTKFSFTANSSLSGGRHPCSAAQCRSRKVDEMISFAALYADDVYIQNPFDEIACRNIDEFGQVDREEIFHAIGQYLYLAPFIENGLIKYSHNSVRFCQDHYDSVATPLIKNIKQKEANIYNVLVGNFIEKCTFIFDVGEDGGCFLKVTGPEAFIEHGVLFLHLYEGFTEQEIKLKYTDLPHTMTRKEIENEDLMNLIVAPILRDLSHQEWQSALYKTNYLCDNAIQMRMASNAGDEQTIANSKAFENGMKHILPSVFSTDPTAIIKLRESEAEAFSVYRDKLSSALHEADGWSEKDVKAIFRDLVQPEINLIDKRVRDWKSNTREGLAEKIIFGSGAVAVGMYSGILPPDVGEIVAALGGGSAVAGVLSDFNKSFKTHQHARKSDYYFVWEARRRAEANK